MLDLQSKAEEVSEQGYCVIESVYSEQECKQIRTIFKELCHQKGGFSNEQPTISFHPLLKLAPEMAPFYAKPILVNLIASHTAARQYLITVWYLQFCRGGTTIILGRSPKQAYTAVTQNEFFVTST